MKFIVVLFEFHLNMFPGIQSTVCQHWFRWWLDAEQLTSYYLKQCWRSLHTPIWDTWSQWVKFKFRELSFTHNLLLNCPIALKFYTEHDSITAVLCVIFQNDLTAEIHVCSVQTRYCVVYNLISATIPSVPVDIVNVGYWKNEYLRHRIRGNNNQFNQSYQIRPCSESQDDIIKWKHFPRYWPFVRGIHR